MEVMRNAHKILVEISEWKKSLQRSGHRWEHNIKIKIYVDYSIGNMV
jgi:hypothetical protein